VGRTLREYADVQMRKCADAKNINIQVERFEFCF
jgi:hypothetical protein